MTSIRTRAANYGERPDITARTMLVTVFGDSIAPAGGAIWIGDLIKLMEPFSFSDRLVRTSLFRLGEDGLFDTERIGRRSRYSLSKAAQQEFAAADARIYYQPAVDWDDQWTIVFANDQRLDDTTKAALARALRWQGFGRLAPGVFAAPTASHNAAQVAISRVGIDIGLPTATAQFGDLEALVKRDTFNADFGLDESASDYNDFIADWKWFKGLGDEDGHSAVLVRSMMVHDFRQARLADPELPAPLLPTRWPGRRAYDRAAQIFHAVDAAANTYLRDTWSLETQTLNRFP